ncbi:MAG: aminotransferase class I/II-fold pyridoxal phosphate-dependent enzyme, partial [Candidatus Methanoperedens sp.]|nr:aminotransferase class I/II-fold pyridoxal phosphate-dependent enzyme [Candidatus Methanoperedens sp.]
NISRSFIFSTALSPPDVAAASTAIDIIRKENPARKLWENIAIYKKGLIDAGFNIQNETQIIPLITGDTETTRKAASELEKLGIFVQGIRPPAVPEGKGRIRTTLMATHSRQDITEALIAIRKVKEKFKL